jgi:DNA-binding MarR family transcriptional regulator
VTKLSAADRRPDRVGLEKLMSADLRAITAQSDRIGRLFAQRHDVSGSDFHALLHIMVAETTGTPLNLAELRKRMHLSAPAITYLVDRMIDSGHIRREPDPADRRKSLLRYEESGMVLARCYFSRLGTEICSGIADLPDRDLAAAHRVFAAMLAAMSTFEVRDDTSTKPPAQDAEHETI